MPDKKLTDNEIIKALECCVSEQYTCEQCPYQEIKHYDYDNGFEIMPNGKRYDDWSCERWLNTDLLDIINRQKAEIERLESTYAREYVRVEQLTERLETAKAEAIKEFAERLKEYREIVSYDRDFDAYVYGSHIHIDIYEFENLVKEIAGEQ